MLNNRFARAIFICTVVVVVVVEVVVVLFTEILSINTFTMIAVSNVKLCLVIKVLFLTVVLLRVLRFSPTIPPLGGGMPPMTWPKKDLNNLEFAVSKKE